MFAKEHIGKRVKIFKKSTYLNAFTVKLKFEQWVHFFVKAFLGTIVYRVSLSDF